MRDPRGRFSGADRAALTQKSNIEGRLPLALGSR